MVRVGVFGAGGRMGAEVCRAVVADPELELVAAVDPFHAGIDLRSVTRLDVALQIAAGPEALLAAEADVAVDFTQLDAARQNLAWLAEHGLHAVVGTTGFTPADLTDSVPGPSPGQQLPDRAQLRHRRRPHDAELAAPWFETAEIIELHHDGKVDAPSGTAMRTAERMAAASAEWGPDPTQTTVVPGARGGQGPGGIAMHSVRLRGLVAHQEVLLGTAGQTLTIRHDSFDRSSFMPGVVLAVKRIVDRPGLTVGLDALLDLYGKRGLRDPSLGTARPVAGRGLPPRPTLPAERRDRPGLRSRSRPHSPYALGLELLVGALGELFWFVDAVGADLLTALAGLVVAVGFGVGGPLGYRRCTHAGPDGLRTSRGAHVRQLTWDRSQGFEDDAASNVAGRPDRGPDTPGRTGSPLHPPGRQGLAVCAPTWPGQLLPGAHRTAGDGQAHRQA